jgi:colicin import membrane protein
MSTDTAGAESSTYVGESATVVDSGAAATLLEKAAHDVSLWLSEARLEADTLVSDAKAAADELIAACHATAERVKASAHAEADKLLSEARSEADRVRAEIADAKREHDAEVARLEHLESGYRDQLRGHLKSLLSQVDEGESADPTRHAEPSGRDGD